MSNLEKTGDIKFANEETAKKMKLESSLMTQEEKKKQYEHKKRIISASMKELPELQSKTTLHSAESLLKGLNEMQPNYYFQVASEQVLSPLSKTRISNT